MSEVKITIFLIGKVSSGKSSLLNALSGNFISNVSLQRETFNPINFSFSKEGSVENIIDISNKLAEQHIKNEEKRQNLNKNDTSIESLNPIKFSFSKEESVENIIKLSNKLIDQYTKNEENIQNPNKDDTLIESCNPIKSNFLKEGSAENIIDISNTKSSSSSSSSSNSSSSNSSSSNSSSSNSSSPDNVSLDELDDLNNSDDKDNTLIEALKLPELYNYGELNIIDFPGLDDSDDKDGQFFNLIKKYIHLADLMLYVTDASCTFVNSSEINLIEQLTELITTQQNINHHYIKFIMIVNKFDIIDDADLTAIYKRIPSKTSVPKCDIYRVSSHKLLIDSLIYNKKNLIVPKFMGKEFRKILQTCNVGVNKNLKNTLSNEGRILHTDIEYQSNIDSDIASDNDSNENKGLNYKIIGDWDSLIDRIHNFGKELYQGKYDMMDTKYSILLKKYVLSYKESSHRYNYNETEMKSHDNCLLFSSYRPNKLERYSKACDMVLLSEFISFWDISHQYYSPKIVEATCEIFENPNKLLDNRFYFLEMIIKYCNSNPSFNIYARNNLIDVIINNLNLLSIETKIIICYLSVNHPKIDNILYNILIDKKSFNYDKLFIYNEINTVINIREAYKCISSTWIELIPYSKSLSFVTYMSENIQNKVLKKLLKISVLKREYLIVLFVEKLITKKDFLVTNDYHKFIHWILTSSNDDILYHKLFNMSFLSNSTTYLSVRNNFIK